MSSQNQKMALACSRSQLFFAIGVFKFYRKTPVLESLFNEDARFQVFSCEICKISKNTVFYRTPPVAASVQFHELLAEQLVDTRELCCLFKKQN